MRIIGHLDMDAFFASVEERERPWLKGKAVVVGADPKGGEGRGVVSTANYKAREYGVRSALPISKAWQFCEKAKKRGEPPCVFLAGNFKKYSEVSRKIMEILHKYSSVVEEASIDEAYFEISGGFGDAEEIAKKIKQEVKQKEKLTCSIGIGPNKLIAKISSDFKKPDGLTIVTEKEAEEFLGPLPIRKVPGIGPKTEARYLKEGIRIIKDLPRPLYERLFNDSIPLVTEWEAKSIGEEETFENDTLDSNILMECLSSLCGQVYKRLDISRYKTFRTVVLKIRFQGFETKTRTHTSPEPISDLAVFKKEAMKLLLPFLDKRENPRRRLVRLIGVRIEKLL
jgi:DNA polymerase IV (archaeal DinB-like DNA polymerase)